MDEWYYRREEASFGPITAAVLYDLMRRKRVQEDTLVRRADQAEWRTAIQVFPSLPAVPDFDLPQAEPLPWASDGSYHRRQKGHRGREVRRRRV